MEPPRVSAGICKVPNEFVVTLEIAGLMRAVDEDTGKYDDDSYVLYLQGSLPDGRQVQGHTRLTLEQMCGLIAQITVELDDAGIPQEQRDALAAPLYEKLRSAGLYPGGDPSGLNYQDDEE